MSEDTDRIPSVFPTEFTVDQEEIGDGEFKIVEWVSWQKKGNPNHGGREKVARLEKHFPDIWAAIKPYYEAWKKNEAEPVNGTPLFLWPAITKKQADDFKMKGIRSVEDVAETTDADLSRMGMGASALREKARQYIANKRGRGDLEDALKEKDKQITELSERLASLTKVVEDLANKEEDEGDTAEPKKRGRKPKA